MQFAFNLSTDRKLSLQNEVFERIRTMILDGQLRPGDSLPATRIMSDQLQVSRNTISLAYERLRSEGYLETRRSVGTFVSSQLPEAGLNAKLGSASAAPERTQSSFAGAIRPVRAQSLMNPHHDRLMVDFWVGRPDPRSFPTKLWSHLIAKRLLYAGANLTDYRQPWGQLELRQEIAKHLRPARGIIADPDDIMIIGGCQDGLNLVGRLLLRPGTPAVVERPCYQGAAYLFESLHATLFPVPVDAWGLNTMQLPDVSNAVVYVTPSHHYPLGVTLSLERRLELLTWASRTQSYVVEDDYDSDFRFEGSPITALKGLDRFDRVIYLGTFSKCMGAGLRLGYAVVPTAMREAARNMKALMNNGQPWLEQAAMADFMKSGHYVSHLRRIRRSYMAKRECLLAALSEHFGSCTVLGDPAGMHLAWHLPESLPPASKIEAAALKEGVGVYTPTSGCSTYLGEEGDSDRVLVMGFSSLTEKEIKLGIGRLAASIHGLNS